MLRSIDSDELTDWIAYDQMDPIGETRADIRTGLVCSTFANVMGGGSTTPSDFMLFQKKPAPEPVLESDPEAHSQLIMSAVFGIDPKEIKK